MIYGPASSQAQDCISRWHRHMHNFYEPTAKILLGLADMNNENPEFIVTFRRIHPELSGFMREAIQIYCQQRYSESN